MAKTVIKLFFWKIFSPQISTIRVFFSLKFFVKKADLVFWPEKKIDPSLTAQFFEKSDQKLSLLNLSQRTDLTRRPFCKTLFQPRDDNERTPLNQLKQFFINIVVLFWWRYKMFCVSWKQDGRSQSPLGSNEIQNHLVVFNHRDLNIQFGSMIF